MKLRQRLHDDADERQVEQGHPGLDLRVGVARVRVVAGQKVVHHVHHLLVQSEHAGEGHQERRGGEKGERMKDDEDGKSVGQSDTLR